MFERFTQDARRIVLRAAEVEARGLGAHAIEAEHLLLALSDAIGVGHEVLVDALELETAVSLDAVGVSLRPPPPGRNRRSLRMGASAKLALHRALKAALARSDREVTAKHLARGVLPAEVGTVPRALALAGLDRQALAAGL